MDEDRDAKRAAGESREGLTGFGGLLDVQGKERNWLRSFLGFLLESLGGQCCRRQR